MRDHEQGECEEMKKITYFWIGVIAFIVICCLSGCNKQVVDFTYSYERAVLCLPNGEVIDGKVQSWKDFDDGDQIQVKINGKQYLVHSEDIVLISE